MANKKIKIGVVIVNYNGTQDTIDLVRSLRLNTKGNVSFFFCIVDNGSDIFSFRKLRLLAKNARKNKMVLIRNTKNLGLSKALNQGYKRLPKTDYIWRLDNDVIVKKSTLPELLKTMTTHADCGCVGSIALGYENHKKSLRGGWRVIWRRGSVIPLSIPKTEIVCDFVSGYSLLFREGVAKKIGYLSDENFFAYVEDVDICRQVQKHGMKIYLNPKAVVYHREVIAKHYNPFLIYLSTRNRIYLMRKNTSLPTLLLFTPYMISIATAFNIKNILHLSTTFDKKIILFMHYIKGLWEGYFNFLRAPIS